MELATCLAFLGMSLVGEAYGKERVRDWYFGLGDLLEVYEEAPS